MKETQVINSILLALENDEKEVTIPCSINFEILDKIKKLKCNILNNENSTRISWS